MKSIPMNSKHNFEQDDCLDILIKKEEKNPEKFIQQKDNNRPNLKRFLKSIPSVPKGKRFHIEIISNWGDTHYVGLTGIELFNDKGQVIEVAQDKI